MKWKTISRAGQILSQYELPLKALAIAVALAILVLVLRAVPMDVPLEWLRQVVGGAGRWSPLIFVAVFVTITAVLLPGWPLTLASGTLFGPLLGGLLSSLASTGAAAVSFLIGRYLARDWIETRIRRYPRLNAVYRTLGTGDGWRIVAAFRLSHSLPFGLQNFLLGLSPVHFGAYLLTTWLVTLPGIFFMAYIGYVAGESPAESSTTSHWALRAGGIAVAGLALFFLGRVAFTAVKSQEKLARSKR